MSDHKISKLIDVSDEELWNELSSRHHAVVMVCADELTKESESAWLSFSGGRFTALGLLKYGMDVVTQELKEDDETED